MSRIVSTSVNNDVKNNVNDSVKNSVKNNVNDNVKNSVNKCQQMIPKGKQQLAGDNDKYQSVNSQSKQPQKQRQIACESNVPLQSS